MRSWQARHSLPTHIYCRNMDVLKQFKSDCLDKLFEDFKPDNDYSFNDYFLKLAKEGMVNDPTSLFENFLHRANYEYEAYNAFRDYELAEKVFIPNAQDLLLFTSEEVYTHGGEWVSHVLEGGIPKILGNAYAEFTDQLSGFTYGVDETFLYEKVLQDYGPEKSVDFIKKIGDDVEYLGLSETEFNTLVNYIVNDYIPLTLDHDLDRVKDLCHNIKNETLLWHMVDATQYIDYNVHTTIQKELPKNKTLANFPDGAFKEYTKKVFKELNIAPDWPENTPIEGKKSINIPNDRDDRPKRGMDM